MEKYIKCFSEEKCSNLIKSGFTFLYEQNSVFYLENNEKLNIKFSDNELFEDIKFSNTINL